MFLAKSFGCRVDGFDHDAEFIDHSNRRAKELGLESEARFSKADAN